MVFIGKEADEDDFGLEPIGLVAKVSAEMACVACLRYAAQWIFVRLSNIICVLFITQTVLLRQLHH